MFLVFMCFLVRFCVWSTRGKFFEFPRLQIAHHRTFQPTFSDITVSFLRSTLYYVPGLNKNLEETNVPVFYKDCSTSCLFGASWFVIACFPFCSSEISMMTSFGYFYCFAWPPKNFFNHTQLKGSPMRTSSQEESSSLEWSLHHLQGSYWSAWWKGGQYIDHIQFIQYI